jgi:hypothetical protein
MLIILILVTRETKGKLGPKKKEARGAKGKKKKSDKKRVRGNIQGIKPKGARKPLL